MASQGPRNASRGPPDGSAAVRQLDRDRPEKTLRRQRVYVTLTEVEHAKVEAFMADAGVRAKAAALVQLINAGLRAKGI